MTKFNVSISVPVKRRASSDHCATASVSPKRDAATSGDDRGPRSRGGKPPIDRMKQDMKVLQETSENDANKDVADKSPAAPPMEKGKFDWTGRKLLTAFLSTWLSFVSFYMAQFCI